MPELWQCTLYDTLTDYPYADWRVYRTREEAERRAERMTYTSDQVKHGASVHKVKGCWKEPDADGVPVHVGDVMDENAKLRELALGLHKCLVNEGCEGCPMQDDDGWCVRDIQLRKLGVIE